jgi:hypothetical protein|tara:strand:+ start:90 stop:746 length:657 start_codon:yes stop_codon:yes gene_type:complete
MGGRSPNAQRLVPCMPPLMEEETIPLDRADGGVRYGGTACENFVKAYFLSQGINIAEPYVDDGVDLLIEKPEGWVRGQVKKVVYQLHLDSGIFKRTGKKVFRSRFNFNFQGGGASAPHLKNGRRQRGAEDCDYFYHVLLTPYRKLIWETPVSMVPLREDGNFIFGKTPCLDRDNWKRKPAEIDFRKLLVYNQYDPIIFKTFSDFFLKPEQPTLDNFFA